MRARQAGRHDSVSIQALVVDQGAALQLIDLSRPQLAASGRLLTFARHSYGSKALIHERLLWVESSRSRRTAIDPMQTVRADTQARAFEGLVSIVDNSPTFDREVDRVCNETLVVSIVMQAHRKIPI